MTSSINRNNIFEELGAVPEDTPPEVYFGDRTVDDSEAPPDLRLRAHMMRLPYTDDRVNDPEIRQWMEDRRLGVGASEVAVLFGLSPWQNLRELWSEKVHGCSYEPGSELFHWGHTMEPVVAAEFERRTGETVGMPSEMIIIGEQPYYRASLDRVVLEDGEAVAALELKNLHEGRFAEYKEAGPSVGYLLQLQYQMMCAELDYGYLACLFGGQKLGVWRVVASPSVQAEIRARVDEFWGYVERKEEPPEHLGKRKISIPDGTLQLTDPSWEQKLQQLEALRIHKAGIEKEEKMLKSQIKETMGDFSAIEAGEMAASVSISTRRSLDTTRLKEECPELVERYMKEASIKSLRVRTRKS